MLNSQFVPDATLRRGLSSLTASRLRVPWVMVEVVVITLALVGLGLWLSAADPLFVRAAIPWTWFAPVLLALRYGVLAGLGSMTLVLAAWLLLTAVPAPAAFPKLYFVGGLLMTMVCGEFSGLWRARVQRLAEANNYLEDRIERVTQRLFVAQRSHDQLEQELLVRPATLRQSLLELRGDSLRGAGAGAQQVLEFLAAQCQIEGARIIAVGVRGRADGAVLASIGAPIEVDADDALLLHALEQQRLAHVQSGLPAGTAPTRHLAAAPLLVGPQRQPALLVVSQMPFLAFHEEAMQTLSVLCSAFCESPRIGARMPALLLQLPGCPAEFAEELCRLDDIARDHAVASHLVALTFNDKARGEAQRSSAERLARSPDVVWARSLGDGRHQLLTLMPMAGEASVRGYVQRLQRQLQPDAAAMGGDAPAALAGLRSRSLALGRGATGPALRRLLELEGA